jgi:hypothetical protein
MPLNKSADFSRIVGKFGENIFFYWLSRMGCEVLWADTAGIDLLVSNKPKKGKGTELLPEGLLGIQIKSRCRNFEKENQYIRCKIDNLESACKIWNARPYVGIMADLPGIRKLELYLMDLQTFKKYAPLYKNGDYGFKMREKNKRQYEKDPRILKLNLTYEIDDLLD